MRVACIIRSSVFNVKGGDTTQFVKTIEELRKLGVECDMLRANEMVDYNKYDLLHFFNIIRPADHLKHIRESGKPYVISTIYLDYSHFDRYGRGGLYQAFFRMMGKSGSEYAKNMLRYARGQDKLVSRSYLLGHRKGMRKIMQRASLLLPNSHSEYRRLAAYTKLEQEYMVVPNGIDPLFFDLDKTTAERQKKVVSVGQVYGRKNQHLLIQACKKLDVPLDIIGKSPPNHSKYYDYCKSLCNQKVRLLGYIPGDELLRSYASSWVHALPSWFETTGLSSLEAGAMGCNLVVGAGGDTREYFEGYASFCEAGNLQSIVDAIGEALQKPLSEELREVIRSKYTWKRAAEVTLEAYKKVLEDA